MNKMLIPEPQIHRQILGGNQTLTAMQEWGNPNGSALLLFHAFSQSHLSWRSLSTGPLAEWFNIVTFDNHGHGNSQKPLDLAAHQAGDLICRV